MKEYGTSFTISCLVCSLPRACRTRWSIKDTIPTLFAKLGNIVEADEAAKLCMAEVWSGSNSPVFRR
eukprot:scaffold34685_cov183-Amphora_coffeaeformis.AAC.22